MMRFLVIDKSDFLRQIMVTLLESKYGVVAVGIPSVLDAFPLLKTDDKFDCVICDENIANHNPEGFYQYIRSHHPRLSYISSASDPVQPVELVSEYTHHHEILGVVDKNNIVYSLDQILDPFIKNRQFHANTPTYFRISV